MLLQFICSYLQNQSWNASNDPPPDQNSPAAQWPTWSHRPEQWVPCSTSVLDLLYVSDYILCDGLVLCIGLVIYVMDYSMYWTIFCVSDLLYVSDSCYVLDLWYMWWTCVICIDVILVIVNYIFVIITACNDPCIYIYFCCICIEKQRKKKQKKEKLATLPSA